VPETNENAGWTANSHVHWIVGVIGNTMYAASAYIIMQCVFIYIPMSYPQYAASLFAGNDLFRSAFAFAAILFSPPLYNNLGIGQGISLLGGLSVLGIGSVFFRSLSCWDALLTCSYRLACGCSISTARSCERGPSSPSDERGVRRLAKLYTCVSWHIKQGNWQKFPCGLCSKNKTDGDGKWIRTGVGQND
jgi:hypothetical protein